MKNRMRSVLRVVAGALLALPTIQATAQNYPDRAVRIIVPAPAGSPGDIIARALAQKFTEGMGQSFVIDNRAGANYGIGTEAVAKSAADGYTLLLTASPHTINPHLYPNQAFDPIRDFAPITLVAVTPLVLVVHPSVPANSVAELLALARSQPGKLNFGSAGNGSTLHLAGEIFNTLGAVKMVHVPYKGVTQAVTDLVGGQLSLMFPGGPIALPQARAGKLRALATTGAVRTAAAPDLPTVAEAGLPGFEISAWYGMLAPAGTPSAVITRLHREILNLLQTPELKERWLALGADIVYQNTPELYGAFLRNDLAKWAKVIKDANVRVE